MTCLRINNRWILSRSEQKTVLQYINKKKQKKIDKQTQKRRERDAQLHGHKDTQKGERTDNQADTLTHQRRG